MIEVVIPGYANHGGIAFEQAADNVVFHAAIHQQHAFFPAPVSNHFFAAYFGYLIFVVGIDKVDIFSVGENKFASHRSFFSNEFSQLTGIDSENSGHFVFN